LQKNGVRRKVAGATIQLAIPHEHLDDFAGQYSTELVLGAACANVANFAEDLAGDGSECGK
jgi:hypothetical protein